jgi:hypothetical protein
MVNAAIQNAYMVQLWERGSRASNKKRNSIPNPAIFGATERMRKRVGEPSYQNPELEGNAAVKTKTRK